MNRKIAASLTWLKDTSMITILFIMALAGGLVKEIRDMYSSRDSREPQISFSKWFRKNM